MSRPDRPVCAICHDPIIPADHWETLVCPTIRNGAAPIHVTCLWALEETIR